MNGSLYLFPEDTHASCEPSLLLPTLSELEIIAEPLGKQSWYAGDGFARHIVFAGCSPYLRFAPEAPGDTQFCHVALHGAFEQAQIITGENTVKPRCPDCRSRLPDWQTRLQTPTLPCPSCGSELAPSKLDWRQHAAIGRVLIELRNVFPGEASPSDRLMADLAERSGFAWRYGWARQSADQND